MGPWEVIRARWITQVESPWWDKWSYKRRKTPESPSVLYEGIAGKKKKKSCMSGRELALEPNHADTLILDYSPSRTGTNKCLNS